VGYIEGGAGAEELGDFAAAFCSEVVFMANRFEGLVLLVRLFGTGMAGRHTSDRPKNTPKAAEKRKKALRMFGGAYGNRWRNLICPKILG
jgi:hypothetical protein